MKRSVYWTMLGGVIAFAAFGFLMDFIPFYTQTTEIELVSLWSVIILGALLGVSISLGTKRRTPEGLLLIGAVGFWFSYKAVNFGFGYYDAWVQPINLPYPWTEIIVATAIGALGCMLLGYRLNGWHGMLFLFAVGAFGIGLGATLSSNLMNYVGLHANLQSFFTTIKIGIFAFVLRVLSGALIWCVAWYFYPQTRLERSDG